MYLRNRRRRSVYGLEREQGPSHALRNLVLLLVLAFVVFWLGRGLLRVLGFGNQQQPASAVLYTEAKGIVSVSLQGESSQAAENGMPLMPGDIVSTGPSAHATVRFFDGTSARLDQNSAVLFETGLRGSKDSSLGLRLTQGDLWIDVPAARSFTGSITRTVLAPTLRYGLPAGTQAWIAATSLSVFSAEGQGVTVSSKGHDDFAIGEGQKWALPDGGLGSDPYASRSALAATDAQQPFVMESRQAFRGGSASSIGSQTLVVATPAPDASLETPTLVVQGTFGAGVRKVQVNDHDAQLNMDAHSFQLEIVPPAGAASFDVQITALDDADMPLASVSRTVRIASTGTPSVAGAPTISAPASTGQTYKTNAQEIVLRGTSPDGAVGMMVNDYKLQLFTPSKGTWSYLASQALGNMKQGTNVYTAVALLADGSKSPSASVTIIVGEGETGVVETSGSSSSTVNPATLPTNAPLEPGSLSVTAPTAGTTHVETGTGFLLEGKTSAKTATVWVNDYQLQLYKAGRTTWNYIASTSRLNLKPGANVYRIVARDSDGKIVDTMDYTVTYQPGGSAPAASSSRSSRRSTLRSSSSSTSSTLTSSESDSSAVSSPLSLSSASSSSSSL